MNRGDLHVWAAYYNHNRWQTPLRLLTNWWLPEVLDSGATVGIVEHTIGDRAFEIDPGAPEFAHVDVVQIRGHARHEGIFLQYPLYNVGAGRDGGARYFCFEDPDIRHLRGDWVDETLHMLQSHKVGHTWTTAIDLDPQGTVTANDWGNEVDRSFSAAWLAGEADIASGPYVVPQARALLPQKDSRDWRAHTGYSVAMRADVVHGLGRLPDWFITGSTDYHLWHGFAGNLRNIAAAGRAKPDLGGYTESYYRRMDCLADDCSRVVAADIGVVPGTIAHGWHGSKRLRFYGGREDICREAKYDPDVDIALDHYGLPYLRGDNIILRDGLRRYNRRRNSDCIRVDT